MNQKLEYKIFLPSFQNIHIKNILQTLKTTSQIYDCFHLEFFLLCENSFYMRNFFSFICSDTTSYNSTEHAHLYVIQMMKIFSCRTFCHFRHYIVQYFQFSASKNEIQRLSNTDHHHQHQWE